MRWISSYKINFANRLSPNSWSIYTAIMLRRPKTDQLWLGPGWARQEWSITICVAFLVYYAPCTHQHYRVIKSWGCFVDNMTIRFNSAKNSTTIQSMIITLAKCTQLWEQLLFLSGGALELSKCYYHIIHWQWDELGYPRMTPLLLAGDSYPLGTYEVSEEAHVE